MLSKPEYGWIAVTIGSFSEPASYLTNVPVDILKGILYRLRGRKTNYTVRIDSEGYISKVQFFDDYVQIKTDKERGNGFSKLIVSKNIKEVAGEVIKDIEDNFEDFCNWEPCAYDKEELVEEQRKKLKILIGKVREFI